MATVVQLMKPGGDLNVAEITIGPPAPREVLLRQTAIGVNFIDIYHRLGLYPLSVYPGALGLEGAGVVEEVGSAVEEIKPGDRAAYAGAPVGSYCSMQIVPASRLLRLPAWLSNEVAAAAMIKGLTAHMLLTRTYDVRTGATILVHGAAGGLGSLLVQWAKRLGATVIGTVGSEAKAARASANGADHVLVGRNADFSKEVMALTEHRGVDVAYDGIGGMTLISTLSCVRPFGTVASIGQAAGPIPPISVDELGPRRSLSLARPSEMSYVADIETYRAAAEALFRIMADGVLPAVGSRYPLIQAARALDDLEAGRTTGSILLLP